MIWYKPVSINDLNQKRNHTILEHLDISFVEIGDDFLKASMPVTRKTHQPMGLLHGGASCVLAETVGSMAANCCVNFPTFYCVGIEINANHIKSVRSGLVHATATALHLGTKTQVWAIDLVDEAKNRFCVSRLTVAVLENKTARSAQ